MVPCRLVLRKDQETCCDLVVRMRRKELRRERASCGLVVSLGHLAVVRNLDLLAVSLGGLEESSDDLVES